MKQETKTHYTKKASECRINVVLTNKDLQELKQALREASIDSSMSIIECTGAMSNVCVMIAPNDYEIVWELIMALRCKQ